MKYYAVTEDPNELMHYGILGMKWGVRHDKPRHTGSRRRSPAYKKAQSKLGKMMKSGIKKAEAHWKSYNSPQAKEQRFMAKAMQQARTGTLKYGKLTDDQVRRVTERLALERDARQFGGTEKAKFGKRLKTAIGEGVLLGTTEYVKQRMGTRGRIKAEEAAAKRKEKYEAKESTQRRRAESEQTKEFYKLAYENGDNPGYYKYDSPAARARYISEAKERNRLSEVRKSKEADFNKAYYTNAGKYYAEQTRNRRATPIGSDWSNSRNTPRLTSGYSVPATKQTVSRSNDDVYIIDKNGKPIRKRKTGWRK